MTKKKNAPPEAATGASAPPRWRRAPAGLRLRLSETSKKAQRETLGERCREGEAGCFVQ